MQPIGNTNYAFFRTSPSEIVSVCCESTRCRDPFNNRRRSRRSFFVRSTTHLALRPKVKPKQRNRCLYVVAAEGFNCSTNTERIAAEGFSRSTNTDSAEAQTEGAASMDVWQQRSLQGQLFSVTKMSATRYRRFLKLCEEWPMDEFKKGRDLGTFLRQRVALAFREGENTQVESWDPSDGVG